MPQTVEHLAVLELLGVERGVVALTKADLVDDELLEMARNDVERFLAETPFAAAPVVVVSARDGRGLPELLDALAARRRRGRDRPRRGPGPPAGRPGLRPERDRHRGHRHALAGHRAAPATG